MDSPNLISLLRLIVRWWKPLAIVTGLALIGSIVVSDPHIMPPKYKSEAVILASSPKMTSSQSLFVESSGEYFGLEEDIDRLLSIARSAPLKQYIVSKYNLFDHYKIDSASTRYPNYSVMKELEENYSAIKNDRGAIEITVYDTDKQQAADMCNDIVDKIDDINSEIMLENKRKIYSIYLNKIQSKEEELSSLSDSIVRLKERGNRVNRLSDLNRLVKSTDAELRAMSTDDELLNILEERKKSGLKELNNTISLAEQHKSTLNKDVATVFVLEKAYPAEKKSKPIRWLIVVGAVLGAFLLSLAFVTLLEQIKRVPWQQVLRNE